MGLYDKVKATKKEPPTGGGLLQRSLRTRAGGPVPPAAAPSVQRASPAPAAPARPRPAAAPAPAAPARAAASGRTAEAARHAPAPQQTAAEALASAVARLEAGIDAPPLLFELLVHALKLERATLYLADYARGAFVPCASRGPQTRSVKPVNERVESLFDSDEVRRLSPQTAGILGEPAAGAELRFRSYRSGDNPVGLLVFAPPAAPVDHEFLAAALGHPEIVSLLLASSEQLGEFPPVNLGSLVGVRPAGQSMLLSISYRDIAAALKARAPSVDAAWFADALQRMVARLVGPLGRVGDLEGVPVAVLTERTIDAEILTHQSSLLLGRYLRSLRPLPALVVTQSAG